MTGVQYLNPRLKRVARAAVCLLFEDLCFKRRSHQMVRYSSLALQMVRQPTPRNATRISGSTLFPKFHPAPAQLHPEQRLHASRMLPQKRSPRAYSRVRLLTAFHGLQLSILVGAVSTLNTLPVFLKREDLPDCRSLLVSIVMRVSDILSMRRPVGEFAPFRDFLCKPDASYNRSFESLAARTCVSPYNNSRRAGENP